ncbi:carbohydrate ABC transporter permease [Cohnella silvisoli]|uniref:Sugar ABC transporter permease n=1 Tax=Cohnella silvisoli TaxID=2873699 RepID=A0ABV1KVY1_9BACL|nr:sugar ABC transporter permease [Cohnella silvisoli]MCD9023537.1 sugar ABC transporter permease [Cohnella silvisoli]
MKHFRSNKKAIFLLTFPALFIFSVVVIYPLLQTFYRSFFEWNGLSQPRYIFLENYKSLLHDDIFYTSLYNGAIFALILTVFQLGIGSVLAFILLENKVFGKKILRTSYFIPVVLSVTVVCQLWLTMYNAQFGLINKIFELLHFTYRQDWLGDTNLSIIAITVVASWQFMGYQFAIIYAGMKTIPEHIYEAAKLDGASKVKTHLKITIPLMAETYRICLIFALIGGLTAYGYMNIMTGGGPGTSTYTLTYQMIRSAFVMNEIGYGSASAVVLILECFVVTLIINRFIARERITY